MWIGWRLLSCLLEQFHLKRFHYLQVHEKKVSAVSAAGQDNSNQDSGIAEPATKRPRVDSKRCYASLQIKTTIKKKKKQRRSGLVDWLYCIAVQMLPSIEMKQYRSVIAFENVWKQLRLFSNHPLQTYRMERSWYWDEFLVVLWWFASCVGRGEKATKLTQPQTLEARRKLATTLQCNGLGVLGPSLVCSN